MTAPAQGWLRELWRQHRSLPLVLRFPVLVPLTVLWVGVTGLLLSLPPGPLCDEGMVLFMEGGCDWGESNVFFFSKLGLLVAANFAFIVCLRRRPHLRRGFIFHLGLLLAMAVMLRSGGRCDTYYGHPNGSVGQMIVEVVTFALLGLALVPAVVARRCFVRVSAAILWNLSYVGAFYLWLLVADHWTWTHTFLVAGSLVVMAAVVEWGRCRQL